MIVATLLLLVASPATATQDTTLRLARGTTVEIDGGMRAVQLDVGSGDQVIVAGGRATLEGGTLAVTAGSFLRPRAGDGPFRVTVPAWARVIVTTIGGPLEVVRAPEDLEATAINGDLVVHGGTGTMVLTSMNGRIVVRGFTGKRLEVDALTRGVEIDGATGTIIVSSINEGILLRNIRSGSVEAGSVNGHIDWSGPLVDGGRYVFESHNGNVTLRLSATVQARLQVSTVMGEFDTRIEGRVQGDPKGRGGMGFAPREFTVTYGNGTARVEVETFNGNVRVLRVGDS